MNPGRKRRAGFTLTEILMAVGILGVGMTMVAAVFPVGIDQNRRSRDTTAAAMCARNLAAMMRARRFDVVNGIRNADQGSPLRIDNKSYLPSQFRIYDPYTFLYDDRTYDNLPTDAWGVAGGYTATIFATPVIPSVGTGPYRISMMVYRSGGADPLSSNKPLTAGSYAVDGGANRGEAYLVDTAPSDLPKVAIGKNFSGSQPLNWFRGRDAVIAFTTIVGD